MSVLVFQPYFAGLGLLQVSHSVTTVWETVYDITGNRHVFSDHSNHEQTVPPSAELIWPVFQRLPSLPLVQQKKSTMLQEDNRLRQSSNLLNSVQSRRAFRVIHVMQFQPRCWFHMCHLLLYSLIPTSLICFWHFMLKDATTNQTSRGSHVSEGPGEPKMFLSYHRIP